MITKKLEEAINAQINAEFWSAYLYLSMSVKASAIGHKGIANWFGVQFREEQAHAQILINYLLSRGSVVKLAPIEAVETEWPTPLAMFEQTLVHERKVTSMIHDLYKLANEEHDLATESMLRWFVDEQVEEEDSAQEIIDSLKQVDDSKLGLFMIDKELAARVYATPAPLAGKE